MTQFTLTSIVVVTATLLSSISINGQENNFNSATDSLRSETLVGTQDNVYLTSNGTFQLTDSISPVEVVTYRDESKLKRKCCRKIR